MKFLKNNIFTLAALVFVFSLMLVGDASADVMGNAKEKAVSVFKATKTIVFIVGGFGLIGLAFAAIFGKVKWVWFASLAFGLAVLAAAGSIVDYATGDNQGAKLDDSFHQNVSN